MYNYCLNYNQGVEMNKQFSKQIFIPILALFFLTITSPTNTAAEENSAKQDIAVKDYTWKSSGRGRVGVLKDITLKNLSLTEYKNIQVEVELYSRSGTPLGSLRTTLKDLLPAGSEKTYYNVNLGIMNTDLEDSTARIVSADEKDAGPISRIGRSILVKDYEFSKAQYGTESFIKSITLQNTTNKDYKNVIIKISDLGVGGAKAGYEGYVTKATINKVLPANSTVTFREINVGFTHPDSKEKYIVVSDATPVSKKELKYLYSEQKDSIEIKESSADLEEERKLSLVERYREKLKRENIKISSAEDTAKDQSEGDIKFSIEEKVESERQSAKEKTPEDNKEIRIQEQPGKAQNENVEKNVPEFGEETESANETRVADTTKRPSVKELPVVGEADADNLNAEFKEPVNSEDSSLDTSSEKEPLIDTPSEKITSDKEDTSPGVASNDTADESSENSQDTFSSGKNSSGSSDSGKQGKANSKSAAGYENGSFETESSDTGFEDSSTPVEDNIPVRNYDVAFGGDEVPLPKRDILVKNFAWGSGVPGTLGKLRKLTLENISSITYTDIDILVEYFSPQGTPLGSSQFILKDDILKPNETRDFRNIDVGLVQLIPDQSNIKITVRTAKDIY